MTTDSFFIVMDEHTAWGAGRTEQDAIADSVEWIENNANGTPCTSAEHVRAMLIEEREVNNGAAGFHLYEVTAFPYPDDASTLDGDDWMRFKYNQDDLLDGGEA